MPKTKFQEVIFTIIMVICMVYALVVYNISIDMGGLENRIFLMAIGELPIMCTVAFILELLFVGKIVQKMAFRIVSPKNDKPFTIIMTISALTVCVMCPLMSLIATLLFKQPGANVISVWFQTTVLNFPFALGWQLVVAGPVARRIFGLFFSQKREIA